MSLSLTAYTVVCPSVQLGKIFHEQLMPAHIPRGKFHQSSCVSESTWQLDLGRGHTEYRVEVVLYPVSLCKVRGSLDSMIVSDLDSVDSNTPPPLQREGVCCGAMCNVTSSGLVLYYIPLPRGNLFGR